MEWLSTTKFINKQSNYIQDGHFKDTTVFALFFSALFDERGDILNTLKQMYTKLKSRRLPVEIIFISKDESEEEMLETFKNHGDWIAIEYTEPVISEFGFIYEICSIPKLIILGKDGSKLSRDGIDDIEKYGIGAVLSWTSTVHKFSIP